MEKLIAIASVTLLGFATTSSSIAGAAIGLYAPLSKRVLACILAFAAGSLISALAIDLAFKGAMELHHEGFTAAIAWRLIAGGFATGAIVYFAASKFLEKRGAAVRRPTQFKEYAIARKQEKTKELIELLSKCDLMRHLPAESVEHILPMIRHRHLKPSEVLFHSGDASDALFIVASGSVQIVSDSSDKDAAEEKLAELTAGSAFGEMGLLSGGERTATVRSAQGAALLEIARDDFNTMIAADPVMAKAVRHLSHERAIHNLRSGGTNSSTWASVAMHNLEHLTHSEKNKMLREAGHGAGMAIILGNILDTIPGCLVIGSTFKGFTDLSFTLMIGMFIGGIPESAVSAAMLTKAGYKPKFIFALWGLVIVVGMAAALAGKVLIGSSNSHASVFFEAVAGGAVLALVSHAMIPEAIHEGGSLVVLPTVAGFLFALFLAMTAAFV